MSASNWPDVVVAVMTVITGSIALYEFIEGRREKREPLKRKAKRARWIPDRFRDRRRRDTKPGDKDQDSSQ